MGTSDEGKCPLIIQISLWAPAGEEFGNISFPIGARTEVEFPTTFDASTLRANLREEFIARVDEIVDQAVDYLGAKGLCQKTT